MSTTCTAALLLACAFLQEKDGWTTVKSKEAGFELRFPSEPKHEKQTVQGNFGPLEITTYLIAEPGVFVMVAGFSELPEGALKDRTPEQVLRAEIDDSLKSMSAKKSSETDKPLSGHPGKETLAETESGFLVVSRAYLVKRRYIQLIALRAKDQDARAADVKTFLDSFKLAE